MPKQIQAQPQGGQQHSTALLEWLEQPKEVDLLQLEQQQCWLLYQQSLKPQRGREGQLSWLQEPQLPLLQQMELNSRNWQTALG